MTCENEIINRLRYVLSQPPYMSHGMASPLIDSARRLCRDSIDWHGAIAFLTILLDVVRDKYRGSCLVMVSEVYRLFNCGIASIDDYRELVKRITRLSENDVKEVFGDIVLRVFRRFRCLLDNQYLRESDFVKKMIVVCADFLSRDSIVVTPGLLASKLGRTDSDTVNALSRIINKLYINRSVLEDAISFALDQEEIWSLLDKIKNTFHGVAPDIGVIILNNFLEVLFGKLLERLESNE